MELVVPVGSSIHLISGTSLALLLGIKNHADDTLIYIDHYLAMYSAGETPTVFFFHWMLKIFAGVLAQHRELSLYCLMIHRKTMIRNLRMELNRSDQVYSDVGNLIKFYCQLFRNKILRSDPMRRNLLWRGFWRLTDHTDHFFKCRQPRMRRLTMVYEN